MPYTETRDGLRLFFERTRPRGRRRATVLLVMGFGANGRVWAPAVRRLTASGFEVLALDNRACGLSAVPWRPFTTQTMASDAIEVLDRVGVDRVHVAGASMGGMVAQEVALTFPDRVRSLILACTTGGLSRLDLMSRRSVIGFLRLAASSVLPATRPEDRVASFLLFAVSPEFARDCPRDGEAWSAVAAMLEDPMAPRGVAQQVASIARHDTWPRLGRLQVPVQVQHGTDDRLIPFSAGEELARRIPSAHFEAIDGAGHALILERPDEVSELAGDFISAHAA